MDNDIRELKDREELKELTHRYCYHLDDFDWNAWSDLFSEDVVADYEGVGTYSGVDELEELMVDVAQELMEYSFRVIYQPIIQVDGDTATGTWYATIYDAQTDGTAGWRKGQYDFVYRRIEGEWRISEVTHDLQLRQRFTSFTKDSDDMFGEIYTIDGNVTSAE